jgi:transposase
MAMIWAGIDAGKTHHHCVAIDESGRRLLSRRVANDEPELLELLADVLVLGDEVTWGIDLADGGAALAITILFNHDQPVPLVGCDRCDDAAVRDAVRTRPWIVDDDLWVLIEPVLPPWPGKAPGPQPVPDRRCLQGILCVLHNDIAWQLLPLELGFGSGQTCWRQQAGPFASLASSLICWRRLGGTSSYAGLPRMGQYQSKRTGLF